MLKIELDGNNEDTTATGLILLGANSTVRGLAINRFLNGGIAVDENGGNVIAGNFIGTDVTGTGAAANGEPGIGITTSNNTIGGITAGASNIISGNALTGLSIVSASANGNSVQRNLIGTDITATADLGNGGVGVFMTNASDNIIGGTVAGVGNTIAFNGGIGVECCSFSSNSILGNSIFSNADLGIDLQPAGVNSNDAGDGDTGSNNRQNFPEPSGQEAEVC